MITNSVTHLRSYTNTAIAANSASISPVTPRDIVASNDECFMFSQCFKSFSWCFTSGSCFQSLFNFNIYLDIHVYYLDIQAITTLLCLILISSLCVASFYSSKLSMLQLLSREVTCSGTQKPKAPWVLDLQGWDWVHFEKEWSEYSKIH